MSRFSGKYGEGAMKQHRENQRVLAKARQAEFDAQYAEKGGGMSRKVFGQIRHVERLSNPPVTVSGA